MAGAYDGVKLPVPNLGACFNMRWALIKTPLIGNPLSLRPANRASKKGLRH